MILVSTYLESKSISHITIIIIVELHIVKLREREEQREGHSKVILKIIDCRLSIFDILSLELTLNLFASPSITTHRFNVYGWNGSGKVGRDNGRYIGAKWVMLLCWDGSHRG